MSSKPSGPLRSLILSKKPIDMNERFKQLAQQAKLPDYLLEYGTELCVAPHLERFAKLIIEESIAVHQDDYGVDIIGNVLKKHFRVEE